MIIQQPNPNTAGLPKTYLSTSIGTATSIPVTNLNSFQASWAIQVGETGEEKSEIQVLAGTAPAGTALAIIGTTSYSHPVDTPVYPIKFDKVIFKVSTSGTAGTATAITDGTVTLQPDHSFTQFDHTAGAISYAYKTAYYNSALDVSSDDSAWILPAGNSQYSLSRIRQRIRDKLFNSDFVTDNTLNDWINEWKDQMTNTAIKVNKAYAIGTTNITFANNQEFGTITATDFKNIRRMWWIDGSGTAELNQIELTDYTPTDIFSIYHPVWYYQGDNVFGLRPLERTGTASIVYSKLNVNLTSDSDELPVPMRGYSKSFIDYAMAQAYMKDNNQEAATPFMNMAENERLKFEKEITPRHESGPEMIKVTEPMNEDESYYYF
jgi:hypothetical protein